MIRQRLFGIFKNKIKDLDIINPSLQNSISKNFDYGRNEIYGLGATDADGNNVREDANSKYWPSWLKQTGVTTTYDVHPEISVNQGQTYYKLYGRASTNDGIGRANSLTLNFKTDKANQEVSIDLSIGSLDTNDYFAMCDLDSYSQNDIVVKLTNSSEQKSITYTFTVTNIGSHFVKVYLYQHGDSTVSSNECWGTCSLKPFWNTYRYAYTNPINQNILVKTYYGCFPVCVEPQDSDIIPEWVHLLAYNRDVYNSTWNGTNLETVELSSNTIIKPGQRPIFIHLDGNPGKERSCNIKFYSRLRTDDINDTVELSITQYQNPHPNEINLSIEKIEFPKKSTRRSQYDKFGNCTTHAQPDHYPDVCMSNEDYEYSAKIHVNLIGHTDFTLYNIPNDYEVTRSSNDITVKKLSSGSTTPASFRIVGNNSLDITGDIGNPYSKDVSIGQDSIHCYCDCNRYDACGCHIWAPFTQQNLKNPLEETEVGNFTDEQINEICNTHCKEYDLDTYPSTICVNDQTHTHCQCNNHTIYRCRCEYHEPCEVYDDPCSLYLSTGSSCTCHGPHGSCDSEGYTASTGSSCTCHGSYGSCDSEGYTESTPGGCTCNGIYGTCTDGYTASSACTCENESQSCAYSPSTAGGCTCNGTYTTCTDGYTASGCSCKGAFDCNTHRINPSSCKCYHVYTGCSGYANAGTCNCHNCYNLEHTCTIDGTNSVCNITCYDTSNTYCPSQAGGCHTEIGCNSFSHACVAETMQCNTYDPSNCSSHNNSGGDCQTVVWICQSKCQTDCNAHSWLACETYTCPSYWCHCNGGNNCNSESNCHPYTTTNCCDGTYTVDNDCNSEVYMENPSSCTCNGTYENCDPYAVHGCICHNVYTTCSGETYISTAGTCGCETAYECYHYGCPSEITSIYHEEILCRIHCLTNATCSPDTYEYCPSYMNGTIPDGSDPITTENCESYSMISNGGTEVCIGYYRPAGVIVCNAQCTSDSLYYGAVFNGVTCKGQEYCPSYNPDLTCAETLNSSNCNLYDDAMCLSKSSCGSHDEPEHNGELPISWTCNCYGETGQCFTYESSGCSCYGAYQCSADEVHTTPSSCACHGTYNCVGPYLETESSFISTSGGCTCNGIYGTCTDGYTASSACTCENETNSCAYSPSTPGGCTCNGIYGTCTDGYTASAASSCSCHGPHGDCTSEGYTASTGSSCSCYGPHGDCTSEGYTASSCSCDNTHCNDWPCTIHNCSTDTPTCQCNQKTWYPYCNCHSGYDAICTGFSIPDIKTA